MNTKLLLCLLFLCSFGVVTAQKIKYKDLFPTLSERNWEVGESQLRTFLGDVKNVGEANANLQMGLMLDDQFNAIDIVVDSVNAYSKGDSAIQYYQRSMELITEKELKKNDEYYQEFFRRDLRTGKFGIKVSDVHLDIEKRIEKIEGKIEGSKSLNRRGLAIRSGYEKAIELYQGLVAEFSAYNTLLLAAKSEEIEVLQEIKMLGADAIEGAKEIQRLSNELGSERYKEDVVLMEINEYGKDGMEKPTFDAGTLEIWNFEDWAGGTVSEINGSVALLKASVMSYAEEIRKKKKVVKGGTDTPIDTLSQDLVSLFDKYDPNSVAKRLLEVETSEALIIKQVDISINKALQDSSLIGAQLDIFSAALEEAKKMDLTLASITQEELDQAKFTYEDYINSFFQLTGTASKYVDDMRKWSTHQNQWLGEAVEYWTERNQWGIIEVDGVEEETKVPLFVQEAPESKYYTIGMSEKTNEIATAYGANMDSKEGYIYSFGPDRKVVWQLSFDLPGKDSFKFVSDTIPAVDGAFGFYFLNEAATENNFSLTSFAPTGTLNWSVVVTAKKPPVDFKFDDITQELTILFYPEEQLPLDSDELGYIVIDRTGSAR